MGEMSLSDLRALPAVIDVETAAAVIGCSALTVRRLAREGRLKAVKPGRAWRINSQSVAQYIGACDE